MRMLCGAIHAALSLIKRSSMTSTITALSAERGSRPSASDPRRCPVSRPRAYSRLKLRATYGLFGEREPAMLPRKRVRKAAPSPLRCPHCVFGRLGASGGCGRCGYDISGSVTDTEGEVPGE